MTNPSDDSPELKAKIAENWKRWNAEQKPVRLSPEDCLKWLDGCREFMFEVWRSNPHLRKEYERLQAKAWRKK